MHIQSSHNAYSNNSALSLLTTQKPVNTPAAPIEVKTPPVPSLNVPPPTSSQLQNAIDRVAQAIQPRTGSLQFTIDQDSGKAIVRITDRQTGTLIRQIPSQEMLEIAKSIDRMQGLLMSQKA